MAEVPILSSVPPVEGDEDPVALLAKALYNLGQRMTALETEQKALDANMTHLGGALEAIIEAAVVKLDIKA